MPSPDVAIEESLLARASAFATANQIAISLPNIPLKPSPTLANNEKWLEATLFPAPSFARGVPLSASNQHYGFLQISVFWRLGAGEIKPKTLAAQIAEHFKRGTILSQDGFRILIHDVPKISGGRKDEDLWWLVPVSIPFKCFAHPHKENDNAELQEQHHADPVRRHEGRQG